MQTPLNASASSAGALISNSVFEVPQFQREYSWGEDEVAEFWTDLRNSVEANAYFLGLIILTDEENRKHVVDGQQRLITLSLLATAIYYEASSRGRKALADRVQADFLRSIDYDSDNMDPRVRLSDATDDETFQHIISTGKSPKVTGDTVSRRLAESYQYITRKLADDLSHDPFKRLGKWTDFLTNRLYFAVFIHPDPASAYQVYEVINTRGKELTTADLLKNYVLSQTAPKLRQVRYEDWQSIAQQFTAEGTNNYVQYIRHVVTVRAGHVLPKDLFGFLAGRQKLGSKRAPTADELMQQLWHHLPLYLQMIDPTLEGPAEAEALRIFSALNMLGVIAVRPLLLAIAEVDDALAGMKYVLRLVVRRIVVGNLGTGNVERRLSEAAKKVFDTKKWDSIVDDLEDLNPSEDDFFSQIRKRSFNKNVLTFLRMSVVQDTIVPERDGTLHFIWTKQAPDWQEMGDEEGAYWLSTIGNTLLADLDRRPKGIDNWHDFKTKLLPYAIDDELRDDLNEIGEWDAAAVEQMGNELAERAVEIWYEQG